MTAQGIYECLTEFLFATDEGIMPAGFTKEEDFHMSFSLKP